MRLNLAEWGNSLHSGERTYDIVGRRRRWFVVSIILTIASIGILAVNHLNPGIDFTGGSEFVVSGTENPDPELAAHVVTTITHEQELRVTVVGDSNIQVRFGRVNVATGEEIQQALSEAYGVDLEDVSTKVIGPTWGKDVTGKAITALVYFLVLVAIVMSIYFRAWRMAAAALVALAHDLLFTAGIYAAVGFEVTPASVIGFLTILGYSLYDTVVVFDKVRENTANVTSQSRYTYGELANLGLNQTLVRSINTSVVGLLPVSAILFVGAYLLNAGTLKDISLALFVGMAIGTYSSIFVATPFEVMLRQREPKIREHTARVLAARESGDSAVATTSDGKVRVGALKPGGHQGVQAQPRRKRRP